LLNCGIALFADDFKVVCSDSGFIQRASVSEDRTLSAKRANAFADGVFNIESDKEAP